jgi:hypothetical protein
VNGTITHLAGLEHVADMQRAAERHRRALAATPRRERSYRTKSSRASWSLFSERPKLA